MKLLIKNVIHWGKDKGILPGYPEKQMLKCVSEVGEMADDLIKGKDIRDELGDVLVTLVLIAEQHDTTLEECLQIAYDKISMRNGETINGVFIKS